MKTLMKPRGPRNTYRCHTCQTSIVTVDLDVGTTPFTTACVTPHCPDVMFSSLYRPTDATPTHVWRRPTPHEYRQSRGGLRQHFDLGGLSLHPIQ